MASTPSEDPFDWTIDRVVNELCNNPDQLWSRSAAPLSWPDPTSFERALRENHVNGEVLLTEVNNQSIQEALGVRSLGHRATIARAIGRLQLRSAKYQDHVRENTPMPMPLGFNSTSFHHLSHLQQQMPTPYSGPYGSASHGSVQSGFESPRPTPQLGSIHATLVTAPNEFADERQGPQHVQQQVIEDVNMFESDGTRPSHLEDEYRRRQSEVTSRRISRESDGPEDRGSKRRKLDVAVGNKGDERSTGKEIMIEDGGVDGNQDEVEQIETFESSPDEARQIQTPLAKPERVTIDAQGRKRIAPNLVSTPAHPTPSLTSGSTRPGAKRLNEAGSIEVAGIPKESYLGRARKPVDTVFYPEIASTDTNEREFLYISSNAVVPAGQRLYVKHLMQHFLQQPLHALSGLGGKKAYGVVPHSSRMLKPDEPQFFTMFTPSNNDVLVSKRELSQYPELAASVLEGLEQRSASKAVTRSDPFTIDQHDEENHDWDFLLKKYQARDSSEDILPPYGESASEEEYDSDTWRTIQVEKAEKERKSKHLTVTEIEATTDGSIAGLVKKWHEKKLPIEKTKAWRVWTKARKQQNRNRQITEANSRIDHLSDNVRKMRQDIASHVWHKASEVQTQCKVMEETIFQREEQNWRISVLELDQPPAKPPPGIRHAVPKRAPSIPASLADDEEILDSETDQSEADGLDDFIVEDAENKSATAQEPDHAFDFADDEGQMGVDNEDNGSDEDVISPLKRKELRRDTRAPVNDGGADSKGYLMLNDLPYADESYASSAQTSPTASLQPKSVRNAQRQTDIIDLTKSSDMSAMEKTDVETEADFDVYTPPLNPPEISTPRIKLILKSRESRKVQERQSSSDEESSRPPRDLIPNSVNKTAVDFGAQELPKLGDVSAIARLATSYILERQDRRRLLIKLINAMPQEDARLRLLYYIDGVRAEYLKDIVWQGLKKYLGYGRAIRGLKAPDSDSVMTIAALYIAWVNCVWIDMHRGFERKSVQTAIEEEDDFEPFHSALFAALRWYEPVRTPTKVKTKNVKQHLDQSDSAFQESESDMQVPSALTPHKKRKRAVAESQEAMQVQKTGQQRVAENERRLVQLTEKYQSMGASNADPSNQFVGTESPIVCLNPHIGRQVKTHQLSGIRFMWRELITDETRQGCLLAHTMGLGKTMQVVSLLVTIAECAKSPNEDIKTQVPRDLRAPKTLILCPPSLIDNWCDEFLMWTPPPLSERFGELRKINSSLRPEERLPELSAWYRDGGILIISYDMFRSYVQNKGTKNRDPPLDEEQHTKVLKQLLEGPSIIVADEAHKLKNSESGIAIAAAQFKSKSRIALTGSPLANNLEEYHAMIEWIAPGYLGTLVQFRAKYVEPIQEGLYTESTRTERRTSLRKLQVLKKNLDPKINRADIGVLKGSLPSKTEFFITVPLTSLQEQAYKLYVKSILGETGDDNEIGNARLWDWLAILSLLCNHPMCFKEKLVDRAAGKLPQSPQDSDDEVVPGDASITKVGLSSDLVDRQSALFKTITEPLDSIGLSYRTQVLDQIIDESIKVGDKVLIFSHSIPTLNYLEIVLKTGERKYSRLDGTTKMASRQISTKKFNSEKSKREVYLISTRAGGLGLNLPGANRVILFDFTFNPTWEEQAVGRAYRFGQNKPVFVYRFKSGGTFEDVMYNKAVFKTQLSFRVVDQKKVVRLSSRSVGEYLFHPRPVKQEQFDEIVGKDPKVLDKVLARQCCIRAIALTETFQREDDEKLTAEEEREAEKELDDERLKRNDPGAWWKKHFAASQPPPAPQLPNRPSSAPVSTLTQPSVPTSTVQGNAPGTWGSTLPSSTALDHQFSGTLPLPTGPTPGHISVSSSVLPTNQHSGVAALQLDGPMTDVYISSNLGSEKSQTLTKASSPTATQTSSARGSEEGPRSFFTQHFQSQLDARRRSSLPGSARGRAQRQAPRAPIQRLHSTQFRQNLNFTSPTNLVESPTGEQSSSAASPDTPARSTEEPPSTPEKTQDPRITASEEPTAINF